LKGDWEKIMAKKIKYYGGERIFSLQKEKILEIRMKLLFLINVLIFAKVKKLLQQYP
jgi:hypothetical protein